MMENDTHCMHQHIYITKMIDSVATVLLSINPFPFCLDKIFACQMQQDMYIFLSTIGNLLTPRLKRLYLLLVGFPSRNA